MSGKLSPKQIAIILGGVGLLVLVSYLFNLGNRKRTEPPPVELTIWGPYDEGQTFQAIFDAYNKIPLREKVRLQFRAFKEAVYRDTLLDALAAGTGPDIFFVRNRWIPREMDKLVPESPDERCQFYGVNPLGVGEARALFPTAIDQDLIRDEHLYALPLHMDTLALLYNKNALDQAAIAEPPATWSDLQEIVPFLRTLNQSGQITKAAVAIGGTEKSEPNAVDLLTLIMMQNGAEMTDAAHTRAMFSVDDKGNRGLKAFNFYLQFANAALPTYTWNDDQPYALDILGSGRVAMLFGYYEDLKALKRKSPLASVGVAPMIQLEGSEDAMTAPSYWGLAVGKQSKNPCWAWDFIAQLASSPQLAAEYADATDRLPALRSLVGERVNDPRLGVFARQALTARSWYWADEDRVKRIFNDVVNFVLRGQLNASQALRQAEDQVTEIMVEQYERRRKR